MMRTGNSHYFGWICLSGLALAIMGCGEAAPVDNDDIMRFEAVHPSTRATETGFEVGDKIGVYITEYENGKPLPLQLGGNYKNNNPVIFDGKAWTADPVIYWKNNTYDVFAYYPFIAPESVLELAFSVKEDQDSVCDDMSGYEASDFLWATTKEITKESESVRLTFSHLMSSLRVNLVKGDEFKGDIPEDTKVLIHSTVTKSLIDLSSGDIVKDPYAPTRSIVARKESNTLFSAIIVPQMVDYKLPLVEVICRGVSYLIESRFNFKKGVRHTVNVTLNDDPGQIKIDIGGEIEGWE
ncbi:MAG: fimbrillin family protein [Candidatus Cryptobacteroides sp.]